MDAERLAQWRKTFHERVLQDVAGDFVRVWRCRSIEFGASTLEVVRVGENGCVHQRTDHRTRKPKIPLGDVLVELDALSYWKLDVDSHPLVFGSTEEWLIEARRGQEQRSVYRSVLEERDAELGRFLHDIIKRARTA